MVCFFPNVDIFCVDKGKWIISIDLDLLFGKQKGKEGCLIFFARTVLTKAVELKNLCEFYLGSLKEYIFSKMGRGKDLTQIGLLQGRGLQRVYVIVLFSGELDYYFC